MSENDYMIWFIATAAMIVTVLTVGTLKAADLLGQASKQKTPTAEGHETHGSSSGSGTTADHDPAATVAGGERRLETGPERADGDAYGARTHSNAGSQ